MKNRRYMLITMASLVWLTATAVSVCAEIEGTVRLGYIYTDDEGNESIHQPTFNLYEGPVLSLEDFGYQFTDGTRLRANLKNIILKNRNLRGSLARSGLYGVNLSHAQYRRTYDFDGGHTVRRDRSSGAAWVKPHRHLKLYGGYGRTARSGSIIDWIDPGRPDYPRALDYTHQLYHFGAQVNYRGSMVQGEYRGASYTDDSDAAFDRKSERLKVVAVTPVPRYRNIHLHGGFQHYEHEIDSSGRMLEANTVWGGGRVSLCGGWSAKYSFVWDRATNTDDVVATDNIVNAAYITKTWRGFAQATVGYQYGINDDYFDESEMTAFYVAGSIEPSDVVSLRGEFGMSQDEIIGGQTLTGDEDRTRYRLTAMYTRPQATGRLAYESRMRENEDLGSEADFRRASADLWWKETEHGTLHGSYSFTQGEYENREDRFEFIDHLVAGGVTVPVFQGFEAEFEGSYYRSQRDLDVESTSATITGRYATGMPRYTLEVSYSAHNFDDVLVFDGYYTVNIVEITLSRDL